MRLCASCSKRYKAILKAYNVGPSAMRDKRSLAREWSLMVKDALNGLCWCNGGGCKGTSLPPRIPGVTGAVVGALTTGGAIACLGQKKKSSRSR